MVGQSYVFEAGLVGFRGVRRVIAVSEDLTPRRLRSSGAAPPQYEIEEDDAA